MPHIIYWLTMILLVGLLVALYTCREYGLSAISKPSPVCWILLVLVVMTGAFLRMYWLPQQHNVFYDEFIHIDIGQRAARNQVVALDNYTSLNNPRLKTPKWGTCFYVLQGLWYTLTAPTEKQAFWFNRIVAISSILMAFLLGTILFNNPGTGLWLALLLAVYPLHLRFCTGSSIEITSVFFQMLLFVTVSLSMREDSGRLFIAFMLTAAVFCLVRIDNTLIGIPLMVWITYRSIKQSEKAVTKKLSFMTGMLLCIPILCYGFYSLGKEATYHGLDIPIFLLENSYFWFENGLHPLIFTVFAIIGILMLFKKKPITAFALSGLFVIYTVFYSIFHRVEFNRADFARFALQYSVVILIPAAYALEKLQSKQRLMLPLLLVLLLASSFYAKPFVITPFWPALQREVQFVKQVRTELPQNAILLSETPFLNRVTQEIETFHPSVLLDPVQYRRMVSMQRPLLFYKSIITALNAGKKDSVWFKITQRWQPRPLKEETIVISDMRLIKTMPDNLKNRENIGINEMKAVVGFYEISAGQTQ